MVTSIQEVNLGPRRRSRPPGPARAKHHALVAHFPHCVYRLACSISKCLSSSRGLVRDWGRIQGKPTQYLYNNHTKNSWSGKTELSAQTSVPRAASETQCNIVVRVGQSRVDPRRYRAPPPICVSGLNVVQLSTLGGDRSACQTKDLALMHPNMGCCYLALSGRSERAVGCAGVIMSDLKLHAR